MKERAHVHAPQQETPSPQNSTEPPIEPPELSEENPPERWGSSGQRPEDKLSGTLAILNPDAKDIFAAIEPKLPPGMISLCECCPAAIWKRTAKEWKGLCTAVSQSVGAAMGRWPGHGRGAGEAIAVPMARRRQGLIGTARTRW